MSHTLYAALALAGLLALPPVVTAAEPPPQPAAKAAKDQIYGSQLMTRQERMEHRAKLRAAKSAEEREQIRKEHHEQMQQRAKEKGVTLPDMPAMPAGGGMGPKGGMGPGPRR